MDSAGASTLVADASKMALVTSPTLHGIEKETAATAAECVDYIELSMERPAVVKFFSVFSNSPDNKYTFHKLMSNGVDIDQSYIVVRLFRVSTDTRHANLYVTMWNPIFAKQFDEIRLYGGVSPMVWKRFRNLGYTTREPPGMTIRDETITKDDLGVPAPVRGARNRSKTLRSLDCFDINCFD